MGIVLQQALAWYNLPLTVLLAAVALYWVMVVVGVLSADSFDFDIDADADIDADIDVDADHDLDFDHDSGGLGMAVLRFLNFGQVPTMVVLSALALSMWVISMIANFGLNKAGIPLLSVGIFLANVLVSAVVAKVATAPLKPLFRSLNQNYDTHEPIVGRECVVRSGKVTADSGQAEVEREGASFLINIRVAEGREPLAKGDRALVVDYDAEKDFYLIKQLN